MGVHPWIDSSRDRIHVLTFPSTTALINEGGPAFITSFRALWREITEPVAIVTDISSVLAMPPSFRKDVAEIDREMFDKQRRLCVAWGVVSTSDVQRMMFQAYLWIAPPASPYRIVRTRDAALLYVREALSKAGVRASTEESNVGKVLASARTLAEGVQDRKPR